MSVVVVVEVEAQRWSSEGGSEGLREADRESQSQRIPSIFNTNPSHKTHRSTSQSPPLPTWPSKLKGNSLH